MSREVEGKVNEKTRIIQVLILSVQKIKNPFCNENGFFI